MLKGLQASTPRGALERFTVTRAQITSSQCTSSWALWIHQQSPLPFPFRSRFFQTKPQTLCPPLCTGTFGASRRITTHISFGLHQIQVYKNTSRPVLRSTLWKHKNTQSRWPLSCKWFFSFNIIRLNDDSETTRGGCRQQITCGRLWCGCRRRWVIWFNKSTLTIFPLCLILGKAQLDTK